MPVVCVWCMHVFSQIEGGIDYHWLGLIVEAFTGMAGRFWADDKDKEAETSRRSTRRCAESSQERRGGGRGTDRGRLSRVQGASDSDESGILEQKEEDRG